MGAFLDRPKTDKVTEKGFGNGLRYGVSSMQGWRLEMEDAHCAVLGINGLTDWSFFAVFDGHAGRRVSAHSAANLLESIIQSDDFKNHAEDSAKTSNGKSSSEKVADGIREGFLKLDEKMKKLPEVVSGEDKSGSTAVCAIISPTHFFLANCGDSRAVLSRSGKAHFSTQDHKPANPKEKERIQRAGGSVTIQRVNGSLAVSRALGDYDYKQVVGRGPCEQLISPEPDLTVKARDPEHDEFLILACDGVWDVMNNDDLCSFVNYQLSIQPDLELVASSIIDTCLHKGSKDNISVVLIVFPGAPSISEEAQKNDQECNRVLEEHIKALLNLNANMSISCIIDNLISEKIPNLPPGGGLEAKRTVIDEIYKKLRPPVDKAEDTSGDSSD
ncbi:protein phosphatase 1B-like [Panonychus citri]|uniref:protein phosphatase 1B-like n=1 Tax=Panonychus citri TaxID=50023 RepID=UPI002307E316|nr:protein phosphatase 1B-like [Panonychus citri]XP_053213550.1 protein phosphatase 1B-like [Panonychus citri]